MCCHCIGAPVEPLLRPAEVLRALVLPAARSSLATHQMRTDPLGGSAGPAGDSAADSASNTAATTADLRLALQLGIQCLPPTSDDSTSSQQLNEGRVAGASAFQLPEASAAVTGDELVAAGTAEELSAVLLALLDVRPSAQPKICATAASSDSHPLDSGSSDAGHVSLRQVELASELLQRLLAAVAAYVLELVDAHGPWIELEERSDEETSIPLQVIRLLTGQLDRLCCAASTRSWRTALQLAPIELVLHRVASRKLQPVTPSATNVASLADRFTVLLRPPSLRQSTSIADPMRHSQRLDGSQTLASDMQRAQQAVTECLALCASSDVAAGVFGQIATGGFMRLKPAAACTEVAPKAAHAGGGCGTVQPSAPPDASDAPAAADSSRSTVELDAAALARTVLALPRRSARAMLLASCLSLLPWSTAAEYARLTRAVLPAWLTTLQPRRAAAAAGADAAEGGADADVLQLCARVASLLVRKDALVADDGGRLAALDQMLRHLGAQCQRLTDATSGRRPAMGRRCTQARCKRLQGLHALPYARAPRLCTRMACKADQELVLQPFHRLCHLSNYRRGAKVVSCLLGVYR